MVFERLGESGDGMTVDGGRTAWWQEPPAMMEDEGAEEDGGAVRH